MTPSELIWPLVLIAVAIAQLVTAWAQARRTPPIHEQLAKERERIATEYVTKAEFRHELDALRADNAEQNASINSLSKSLSSEMKQVSAQVGRLQGTLDTLLK